MNCCRSPKPSIAASAASETACAKAEKSRARTFLPYHMGEVPKGRRGTVSKRFVLSPSDPIGPPPPYDAGLSGERFDMTRVHARPQLGEPATFWLSRLRKDRACATAIASLAI